MTGARLRDSPPEETLRLRRGQQRSHAHATSGLAEDRDVVGVAAERLDVVARPLERRDLVKGAEVAGAYRAWEALVEIEKTERVQAVVDRHQDDAVAGERVARKGGVRSASRGEPAAVDPHHRGPLPVVGR